MLMSLFFICICTSMDKKLEYKQSMNSRGADSIEGKDKKSCISPAIRCFLSLNCRPRSRNASAM